MFNKSEIKSTVVFAFAFASSTVERYAQIMILRLMVALGALTCVTGTSAFAQTASPAPSASPSASAAPEVTVTDTHGTPPGYRYVPYLDPAENAPMSYLKKDEKPFTMKPILNWVGQYSGPEIGKNLGTSYDVTGKQVSSATVTHVLTGGMQFTPQYSAGVILSALSFLKPTLSAATGPFPADSLWYWKDMRFFLTWTGMIDCPLFSVNQTVRPQIPTTGASRNASLLFRMDFLDDFSIKLPTKKWSIDINTNLSPRWYLNPSPTQNTFIAALEPVVSYNFTEVWSLTFDLTMDSAQQYGYTFFDYNQATDDTLQVTVGYQPIPQFALQAGLGFYVDSLSFKNAILVAGMLLSI